MEALVESSRSFRIFKNIRIGFGCGESDGKLNLHPSCIGDEHR